MKLILALLVVVLVGAPMFVLVIAPYLHYRANQRFKRWMNQVGITDEMLELAEKAASKDIE